MRDFVTRAMIWMSEKLTDINGFLVRSVRKRVVEDMQQHSDGENK